MQRVKETRDWLEAEKMRLGGVVKKQFANESTTSSSQVGTRDFATWKLRLKCAADLAVFALTLSNPIAFFVAQAVVDGASGAVDAIAGSGDPQADIASATTQAVIGGVAVGAKKALAVRLAKHIFTPAGVAAAKKAGAAGVGVLIVGAIGYQVYSGEGTLATVAELLIPKSCRDAYAAP